MADSEYDHCPRERHLRAAGQILEDMERSIASEVSSGLLTLSAPDSFDLPDGTEFYDYRAFANEARQRELCKRAARAAMVIALADEGMRLPEHIEIAYDLPKSPINRLRDLARRAQTEFLAMQNANPPLEPLDQLAADLGAAIEEIAA